MNEQQPELTPEQRDHRVYSIGSEIGSMYHGAAAVIMLVLHTDPEDGSEMVSSSIVSTLPENHEPAQHLLGSIMQHLGFDAPEVVSKIDRDIKEDSILSESILVSDVEQ